MWDRATSRSSAFGHSIAVSEEHVQTEEVLTDYRIQRRRTKYKFSALIEAKGRFYIIIHQLFG
jgi:hypothetical protein